MNRNLREILGISPHASTLVQLRPELLTAVTKIADHTGRTVGDITNELIRQALYDQHVAENSLQIWQQLTQREREITALIWLKLTNPEIARRLSISPNTVKTHVKNILNKFNVHSKKEVMDLLSGLDLSD